MLDNCAGRASSVLRSTKAARINERNSSSLSLRYLRAHLHVTHELASALKQTSRIGEGRTQEEPNVNVLGEGIDMAKSIALKSDSGVTVVQELLHVFAAGAPFIEPLPCEIAGLEL